MTVEYGFAPSKIQIEYWEQTKDGTRAPRPRSTGTSRRTRSRVEPPGGTPPGLRGDDAGDEPASSIPRVRRRSCRSSAPATTRGRNEPMPHTETLAALASDRDAELAAAHRRDARASPATRSCAPTCSSCSRCGAQWDRALSQLQVAAQLSPLAIPMAQTYREAIRCELYRAEVFAGRRQPSLLGTPPGLDGPLLEALKLLADGPRRRGRDAARRRARRRARDRRHDRRRRLRVDRGHGLAHRADLRGLRRRQVRLDSVRALRRAQDRAAGRPARPGVVPAPSSRSPTAARRSRSSRRAIPAPRRPPTRALRHGAQDRVDASRATTPSSASGSGCGPPTRGEYAMLDMRAITFAPGAAAGAMASAAPPPTTPAATGCSRRCSTG